MQKQNNDGPGCLIYFLSGLVAFPMSFYSMFMCSFLSLPLAILLIVAGGVNVVAYNILAAMLIQTTESHLWLKLVLFLLCSVLYFMLMCINISGLNTYVLFSLRVLTSFLPCIVLGIVSWRIWKAEKVPQA